MKDYCQTCKRFKERFPGGNKVCLSPITCLRNDYGDAPSQYLPKKRKEDDMAVSILKLEPEKQNIDREMAWLKYASCYGGFTPVTIKKVIFNNPATIVYWTDGSKTVVKCQDGDVFDKEKGLAMAIAKKSFGNKGNYCNVFKKFIKED